MSLRAYGGSSSPVAAIRKEPRKNNLAATSIVITNKNNKSLAPHKEHYWQTLLNDRQQLPLGSISHLAQVWKKCQLHFTSSSHCGRTSFCSSTFWQSHDVFHTFERAKMTSCSNHLKNAGGARDESLDLFQLDAARSANFYWKSALVAASSFKKQN